MAVKMFTPVQRGWAACQAKSRMETKPFKAPVDAYEQGVLDSSLNEPFKVVSRDASVGPGIAHPLQSQANSGAVRTVRKKAKGTVANRRRTNPARSKKVGRFLPSLLPADASLN